MNDKKAELVERIKAGDSDALAEFIEAVRNQLMAFIERKMGAAIRKRVEPEDIFQEVSVDAIRSLDAIELGDRDPFSWLCQIAERRVIDVGRRERAQKRDIDREVAIGGNSGASSQGGLLNLLVASMTTPSKAFSRNAREAQVLEALQQLSDEERDALRMRYVENLPSKEIAVKLGRTDGAIRVMLSRTLKKMQNIFGEEPHG